MSVSLLIFDLDGTLIDSAGDLHRAVNRTLAGHGLEPLTMTEVRGMIGDGASRLVMRAFAARGHCVDETAEVRKFLDIYAADPVALTQPYAGVRETLREFQQQGVKLAISTNKPEGIARDVLRRLALSEYFETLVGGDSRPFRKPDPRMLTEIAAAFGAGPESWLMIGDSEIDAQTARAAGSPFVLLTYGYHRASVEEIPCAARLGRFNELSAFLERWNRHPR